MTSAEQARRPEDPVSALAVEGYDAPDAAWTCVGFRISHSLAAV